MSANNWAYCPKCSRDVESAIIQRRKKVDASYGKVSAAEYSKLLEQLKVPLVLQQTLREDYELSTEKDGHFFITYTCSCSVCKFTHSFRHESNVLTEETK